MPFVWDSARIKTRAKQPETEMGGEAQRQRAGNGFVEADAPEASQAVRLRESAAGTKPVEAEGSGFTSFAYGDAFQSFQVTYFRKTTQYAFAADLIFHGEPCLAVLGVQVRGDGLPDGG